MHKAFGAEHHAGTRAEIIAEHDGAQEFSAARPLALGPDGITVNLVSPGRIESDEDPAERRHELARSRPDDQIPLRRPGAPSDVADVVVALARSDFRYVTGQTIHVSGGFYMG